MLACLRAIAHDTSGASATEYALLLAFIAFTVMATITQVGNGLANVFSKVNGTTSNAFATSAG